LERSQLVQPFTEEEVIKAIFGSEASGVPGPDGFTFFFYQYYFELVKNDILILLHSFHSNALEVAKLNHAMVCIIPKEKEAKKIQKNRPISLVDCY
jgi:hypothetical protein